MRYVLLLIYSGLLAIPFMLMVNEDCKGDERR